MVHISCSATLVQCKVLLCNEMRYTQNRSMGLYYTVGYMRTNVYLSYLFVDALIILIDLCLMTTLLHTNLLVFKTTADLCFLQLWSAIKRGPNVSKNIGL